MLTARNLRIAAGYALLAAAFAAVGVLTWPAGVLAFWATLAFAAIAAAYLGLGGRVFRKHAGHVPLTARIALGPFLLGNWACYFLRSRGQRPWVEVADGLLLGRRLCRGEAAELARSGVTAVLDLTAEYSEAAPLLGLKYKNLPVLDLTAPTLDELREAITFIEEQSATGKVYVHCAMGYSRSACVAAAWLLAKGEAGTADAAFDQIRKVRAEIVAAPCLVSVLREFSARVRPRPTGIGP